jgi:hypothetical protein
MNQFLRLPVFISNRSAVFITRGISIFFHSAPPVKEKIQAVVKIELSILACAFIITLVLINKTCLIPSPLSEHTILRYHARGKS